MSTILCVDAGYANAGLVVMAHADGGWAPIEMRCVQTEASSKKRGLRQADDHARRIAEVVREIKDLILKHRIRAMVAEMPNTGGQNATAVRSMGYATAMLVTIVEAFDIAAEWYTPNDTRAAAGVSRSTVGRDTVKKVVMDAMGAKYPILVQQFPTLEMREHVADALATFEAARGGTLVRVMEGR